MFSLLGLSALLGFLYLRPQEFVPLLEGLPLLHLFCAGAVGGLLIDLRLRLLEPLPARSLLAVVPFYAWVGIDIALEVTTADKVQCLIDVTILFTTYVVLCHSVQSFRALRLVAWVLVLCGMFLTFVGIHQANAPRGCLMLEDYHDRAGTADGRSCETARDCRGVEAEPGASYECQRIGLFGTNALDERVRYRGELQDPNALSTVIAACVALMLGLSASRRALGKLLAAIGAALVLLCVIYTQSRGGILAFAAVLGVYFVRRFGLRRIFVGVLLLLPLIALGGRSGSAAQSSTESRFESWHAGWLMLRSDPLLGAGYGQFTEDHALTAHNAHVLAAAELGLPGLCLWVAVLYLALKPPIVVLRDFAHDPRARTARSWATAVLGMGAAHMVQMMFLSLTYHTTTWVFLGVSGAFYSAVKAHAPDWEVRLGLLDILLIAGCAVGFLAALRVLLLYKGY